MALVGLLEKTNPQVMLPIWLTLRPIKTWCRFNQLEMNVAKTNELNICTKQDMITEPVSLDGQHVEIVENFTYLGMILDSQMSFSGNTEYVFKRCLQR